MKTFTSNFIFVLLIALFITGCTSTEAGSGEVPPVICEVYYRPGAGQSLEAAPPISFTGGTEQQLHSFDDMTVEARFQDDQFEGQTLSVVVTNLDSGDEITRQLYQFDSQNPPENQFIGGHGFTGLIYIFHTTSTAEIQYFCSVKQN